jgi:hypothetical protein
VSGGAAGNRTSAGDDLRRVSDCAATMRCILDPRGALH